MGGIAPTTRRRSRTRSSPLTTSRWDIALIFSSLVSVSVGSISSDGPWAWLKVIAQNRRTIFNLVKEGFTGRAACLQELPRAPQPEIPPAARIEILPGSIPLRSGRRGLHGIGQPGSSHNYNHSGRGTPVLIRSGERIRGRLRGRDDHARAAYCSNIRGNNEIGSTYRGPAQSHRRARRTR